jgi:hypothetical protein
MSGSDNDSEIAAYQLSQLLPSVVMRAAEVSAAAQGPSALCLKYGPSPPGPAEVPWLRFASRRKPVVAWVTAAVNFVVTGWRAVTSWATGVLRSAGACHDLHSTAWMLWYTHWGIRVHESQVYFTGMTWLDLN